MYAWWKKGALGIAYDNCPLWLLDAFAVIGNESADAEKRWMDEKKKGS